MSETTTTVIMIVSEGVRSRREEHALLVWSGYSVGQRTATGSGLRLSMRRPHIWLCLRSHGARFTLAVIQQSDEEMMSRTLLGQFSRKM